MSLLQFDASYQVPSYQKSTTYQCVLLAILCCSQFGDDSQEDLATFGYRLDMKI
jgi:hypothetical protein